MIKGLRNLFGIGFALLGVSMIAPAAAHPHVWVKASAEVVYAPDGKVTGVRHKWAFDEAYSAFAVQGLPKNKEGKLTRVELAELAKVNAESLIEFEYFTRIKLDGKKQGFADITDYWLDYENGSLVLNFTLPLKTPAKPSRAFGLEIYDPTFFVSFSFVDGDTPVTLASAPAGCNVTITRPKPAETMQSQNLSESFFSSLSTNADYGAQFGNKALVACP